MKDVSTLVDLLRSGAVEHAERSVYVFLKDGEKEHDRITYGGLDRRARAIAAYLQSMGAQGERVMLVFPTSIEFMAALFGCLYAGAVAVPAPPPRTHTISGHLPGIIEDAQPKLVLTDHSVHSVLEAAFAKAGISGIPLVQLETIFDDYAEEWRVPALSGESIAFLQYTSGSTSRPKGVMVSHSNIRSNNKMIQHAFKGPTNGKLVTWLPLFHDMGLIGNALQAVHAHSECLFMPPEAFLMKPVRWLQAISKYGTQFNSAPNFAYELCARRVTSEQKASLNLSGWKYAVVGAEPVRAETLDRFATAFESCGFLRKAFSPCYGLAEATVFVSGPRGSADCSITSFQADALEAHKVRQSFPAEIKNRILVSCGNACLQEEIVIANPASGRRCKPDEVGEVWVSGPNVAQGYWNRPDDSKCAFGAQITGEISTRRFLRTGDLGFFHDNSLFIAGRLKDNIIIAGRNHHACDIEDTVEKSHISIKPGGCAAFAVETSAEERLVIVAELNRLHGGDEVRPVQLAIRRSIATQHDVMVHDVIFLKPGACPKTSSGKIMRHACRTAFLAGTLNKW